MRVTFIDTSVLCELLEVPGKHSPAAAAEIRAELAARMEAGEHFVIPITAVIETGNHIAQCNGDRFAVSGRLVRLLEQARANDAPFVVNETAWDETFLADLCAGDSTTESLQQLAARNVGAGDVAILVERDRYVSRSAYGKGSVAVWTRDVALDELARR
jgi:hypothetical protein